MALIANPVAYDTLALATAAHIPTGYNAIWLNGYSAAGDGGGALYVLASAGAGPGKFQSADGQWWIIVVEPSITLAQLGAVSGGACDTALASAVSLGAKEIHVTAAYTRAASFTLPDYTTIVFDAPGMMTAAANSIIFFQSTTHAYNSKLISPRLDGGGFTSVTATDFVRFSVGAAIVDPFYTNMKNGDILRSLCVAASIIRPATQGVVNPLQIMDGSNDVSVDTPFYDAEAITATSNIGIAILSGGANGTPVGVNIKGGGVQGFIYGIKDQGRATVCVGTYFEVNSGADVWLDGSFNSIYQSSQHFAGIGPVAYLANNSTSGANILYPVMGSGNRSTGLFNFDSTCTLCRAVTNSDSGSVNNPIGTLTGLALSSPHGQPFTPVVNGSGTAGAGTYSTQAGTYNVSDGQVFFSLTVTWTAHTGTGNIYLTGLPANLAPLSYSTDPIFDLKFQTLTITGPYAWAAFNGTGVEMELYQATASGTLGLVSIASAGTLQITGSYAL